MILSSKYFKSKIWGISLKVKLEKKSHIYKNWAYSFEDNYDISHATILHYLGDINLEKKLGPLYSIGATVQVYSVHS